MARIKVLKCLRCSRASGWPNPGDPGLDQLWLTGEHQLWMLAAFYFPVFLDVSQSLNHMWGWGRVCLWVHVQVCVCICVKARDRPQGPSSFLWGGHWEQGLLFAWHSASRLGYHRVLGILLSLPPHCQDYKHTPPRGFLHGSLCLHGKHFTN